ncbi:MAG: GNAT family N-acetyltransferase [Chloroflexota bacterium]
MENLTITPFQPDKRRLTADLLFYSRYAQAHLDWYEVDAWLNSDDAIIRTAWDGSSLVGLISASQPLNGATWVRVVAVGQHYQPQQILPPLWDALAAALRNMGTEKVCWLLIENWPVDYLPRLGFSYYDEIITLKRTGHTLPPYRSMAGLRVRSVEMKDLPELTRVDHQAFAPPWQMTSDDIRQGRQIAACCYLAELNDAVVGYQLSTFHQQSGHLARLAVLPEMQGRGVGAALLNNLITYFLRRRIDTVTVNTQLQNQRSQRLYARFGFNRSGYNLPVWLTNL